VVSLVMVLPGEPAKPELLQFAIAQVIGGCFGTPAAHAMFDR
jgi:glycerol uptake facilitator-like aquaporin